MRARGKNSIFAGYKYCALSALSVTMLFAALSVSFANECELARQLRDPLVRADYENIVAAYQNNMDTMETPDTPNTMDPGGMFELIIKASYKYDTTDSQLNKDVNFIDPISMECFTCHDGNTAKDANTKIRSLGNRDSHGIQTITGSHPIGMSYVKFANNREYTHWQTLPKNMVLMDGKVGCITCHDMLSKNRLYLPTDMGGSGLCFNCHIK